MAIYETTPATFLGRLPICQTITVTTYTERAGQLQLETSIFTTEIQAVRLTELNGTQ